MFLIIGSIVVLLSVGIGFVGGYGDDSCIRWRPVFHSFGDYVGRRPINICD